MNYLKPKAFLTVLFLVCGLVPAGWASAQGPTKVAIIDISRVFTSHPSFNDQLQNLKAEADQFKASSNAVRNQMMQRSEELRDYQPGSEKYKQLATELAQEAAKVDVEQKSKLRDLMSREAQLHFDTYQQVSNVIRDYCQQRQIQLVLRYNSKQMEPGNPQSIMDKVNGSVVYYAQGKDVTDAIIARVKQANTSFK